MEHSRIIQPSTLLLLLLPSAVEIFAQEGAGSEGIEWGAVVIRSEASLLEAHDNRVQFNPTTGKVTSDFYSEAAGGLSLENLPARYDLSAQFRYGYRFYSDNTDLNDDFYTVSAEAGSSENPLKWGLSANMTKSLNYNTGYDPATGKEPDSILANGSSRRSIIQGNISYEKRLTEKSVLVPGYNIQHYYQEFPNNGTAEWQIHNLNLELQKEYSEKTRLSVGGGYGLQVNDDENGTIGTVEVGAESRLSDKVSWRASVGYAVADYEISGFDQGGILNLRIFWQATEKVSAYVFGGNDFQPGYGGGGARKVYRLGYGAVWSPLLRWTLGGSVLHDYQDSVGSGAASPGVGEVRHFFDAYCSFKLTKRLRASLNGRYINDELEASQTVLSMGLDYRY